MALLPLVNIWLVRLMGSKPNSLADRGTIYGGKCWNNSTSSTENIMCYGSAVAYCPSSDETRPNW